MYQRNAWLTVVTSITLCFVFGVDSAEALPDDWTIDYKIHATPTDPQSDVVFVVRMEIVADSSTDELVGWEVREIRFTRPGEGGNPDVVWVEASPVLASPDGLWWVAHANVDYPMLWEFAFLPWLDGTALPEDPMEDDLDYDFHGDKYTPPAPPGEPPYDHTTVMTYSFTRAMAEDPIEEGEDEIAESDGVNDPS
ncbi:MAG: hypothetical protein ACYTFA_07680 [Planctomycetota bacterium]|jgi:hypothetical protein